MTIVSLRKICHKTVEGGILVRFKKNIINTEIQIFQTINGLNTLNNMSYCFSKVYISKPCVICIKNIITTHFSQKDYVPTDLSNVYSCV